MYSSGPSARQVAAHFNIPSYTPLCTRERIYLEGGAGILNEERRGLKNSMSGTTKDKKPKRNKEIEEDLISELQRLRMENAYLKKLNALVRERIARENGKK